MAVILQKLRRAAVFVVAVFMFSSLVLPPGVQAATSTQSIAIPAYEYPTLTNLWPSIDAAGGSNVPFVIVNPASGPGVSTNSDYTTRINDNTALGIRSIGYVDTSYQARPIADVITDIDLWHSLYPGTTGIFFDQVSVVDAAALCYSAYLYNYVKVKYPNDLVVHNFGTYTSPAYEPYGDIFVNAEMDYTLYQTWSAPTDGFQNIGSNSNRFWHLLHTTAAGDYPAALALTQTNNAGWVYITDDVLPNPYDTAPTYFSTEVSDVGLLPASIIPNRGVTELPAGCLDVTTATNSIPINGSTTSTHTISNSSATYTSPSPNRLSFALPSGVTLASATGTNWSCGGTTCDYANTLAASSSSSALTTVFTASCSYQSGNIILTATTFPEHTETSNIAISRPANCPVGATASSNGGQTLANTGSNNTVAAAVGALLVATGGAFYIKRRRDIQSWIGK